MYRIDEEIRLSQTALKHLADNSAFHLGAGLDFEKSRLGGDHELNIIRGF